MQLRRGEGIKVVSIVCLLTRNHKYSKKFSVSDLHLTDKIDHIINLVINSTLHFFLKTKFRPFFQNIFFLLYPCVSNVKTKF